MTTFRRAALLLLVCLTTLVLAWTKEDHEIFRLRDEVQASEGSDVTFYSFLGIESTAGQADIDKAYRKLSRTLHPDKASSNWLANYNIPKHTTKPGAKPTVHVHKSKKPSQSEINRFNKEASARFERLSLVVNILRGSERQRYDHFLTNGFPTWRGTGYYYERYRPGLTTVLLGLFIFVGGGVHYGALYLSWKRQREFVQRYVKHARRLAWGDDSNLANIPGLNGGQILGSGASTPNPSNESEDSMQWNRKQKRAMEKDKRKDAKKPVKNGKAAETAKSEGISTPIEAKNTGPVGAKKRTRAENGKILIVDSVGNVFLEEETEEGDVHEYLLDPDEIPRPAFQDTFLYRAPVFIYNQSVGRLLNKQTPDYVAWEANGAPLDQTPEMTSVSLENAIAANANAESRRRSTKAKP